MASPLIKGFCPYCNKQTLHLQVDTIECWNPDCGGRQSAHLLLQNMYQARWDHATGKTELGRGTLYMRFEEIK
jgi:hypothetical protein